MSDEYRIEPTSGRFSDEALQAWRAFLHTLPFRRLADGTYQVFETVRERDDFADYAAESGHELTEAADHVILAPRRVTLHVIARTLPGDAFAAFLTGVSAHGRLRITDHTGGELTIAKLCEQVGAVPMPAT